MVKPSELRELAKQQMHQPKPKPIVAGDHLGGDQFVRPELAERVEQGDGTMARLATAHRLFYDGHKNLRAATEARDPAQTPEGHFIQTYGLGERWLKQSGEAAQRAMDDARAEIAAERRAMVAELGLVENHRASEIRAYFRGADDQTRQRILSDAVASKDAATIAAVTEAPAYLTGLSQEQVQAWRTQYEMKHGAQRLARIQALAKATEILDRTLTEAVIFQTQLHPQERLAEIERKQKAAREMRERLTTLG